VAGKCFVLTVLEVLFCLMMQKIPGLNFNASGFQMKVTGSEAENDALVGNTVTCLHNLLDICDHKGEFRLIKV